MSGLPEHRLAHITSLLASDRQWRSLSCAAWSSKTIASHMVACFEVVMKSLAAELPQTRTYRYDIGQLAQVKARFAMIASDLGPVDVLIYNAGKRVWGTAEEVSLEAFQEAP